MVGKLHQQVGRQVYAGCRREIVDQNGDGRGVGDQPIMVRQDGPGHLAPIVARVENEGGVSADLGRLFGQEDRAGRRCSARARDHQFPRRDRPASRPQHLDLFLVVEVRVFTVRAQHDVPL